jgi:hypothetical protein
LIVDKSIPPNSRELKSIKKTVDLGSTVKTFIAHKTKLDEYRTFLTLTING